MKVRLSTCALALSGALLSLLSPARGQEGPLQKQEKRQGQAAPAKREPTKFLRVLRSSEGAPTALETAVVRYVPFKGDSGLSVDLVSVVHVGDRDYFLQLNKQFKEYDVVLYELVAPRGTRVPLGGQRSDNPLALVQGMMKTGLKLESQTEWIDYTKENFVHADLSFTEMGEVMKKRGEDPFTLGLGVMTDMLRQQNLQALKAQEERAKPRTAPAMEDVDLLSLLTDPDAPVKLKRLMAEQFVAHDSPADGLGPTLGALLINDRNAACMKEFQKQLAAGKKKIAIFYGAGHMNDFEKRLKEDFDLEPYHHTWMTAWDLRTNRELLQGP